MFANFARVTLESRIFAVVTALDASLAAVIDPSATVPPPVTSTVAGMRNTFHTFGDVRGTHRNICVDSGATSPVNTSGSR